MIDKLLAKHIAVFMLLWVTCHFSDGHAHAQAINQSVPTEIFYEFKISEITNEEDLKSFDYVLRPLFDAAFNIDLHTGMIQVTCNAIIREEKLFTRLQGHSLHLAAFHSTKL